MYEKLLQRLREAGETLDAMADFVVFPNLGMLVNLMNEAADAIEELVAMVRTDKEFLEQYGGETGIKNLNEFAGKYWDVLAKIPRWIPVMEKLPDTFKHVLVNIPGMTPHPTVQEAFLEKNGMWYSNGFRYFAEEITHWMPLPTPPEPKKEI